MQLGAKKPLEKFPDPKRAVEIETKIDILFPDSNFYFYDASKRDQEKVRQEESEVCRLLNDSIASTRVFLKDGNLEPIHHRVEERQLFIEQM